MEEVWKDIEDYEGLYQVSSFGRVKRIKTDRILTSHKNSGGYLRVDLSKNSVVYAKSIHRLVAQAFIPNPENKSQVNHIDEDKTNNKVSNLEWMTAKENSNHGTRNERVGKAISKSNSVPIIATNLKTGESTDFNSGKECARKLSLHQASISRVLRGRLNQTGGYTFKYKEEKKMNTTNELITLTRIDETTLYVNVNHIAAFYHNKSWEYTIIILSDGTQLDIKESVESIAKYFS